MPMVIRCEHCKAPLKLPEEYIGKNVRCPSCQKEFVAREELAAPPPRPPAPSREPERRQEDPDPRREERPSSRRRDDDDYRGRHDDDYPDRRDDDDYPRPRRRGTYYRDNYREPHRGGLVLTLGILSMVLCLCPIAGLSLGISAVTMANADNEKMRRGSMDPSGQGPTTGGLVCGIIGIILSIIGFIFGCIGGMGNNR